LSEQLAPSPSAQCKWDASPQFFLFCPKMWIEKMIWGLSGSGEKKGMGGEAQSKVH
jgi:hypothetical protein